MKSAILVFGLPRSGTTWVGKLFDSHPDTLYRHEPDSVRKLRMPLFPAIEGAQQYTAEIEDFLAGLPRMRSPEVVGKQPLFSKSYQSAAALAAYRASVVAAKSASHIWRHAPCVYRPTAGNGKRAHLVWKSIESSGRLGVIMKALPNARAIYLMRHPCGYMASVMRGKAARRFSGPKSRSPWLLKQLLSTSVGKRLGPSLDDLKRLTYEEHVAWRWVLSQENVLADIGADDRVLVLRYEDVCAQPLALTRRMFEFSGLDWSPQTEAFVCASTQTAASVRDTGYYSVYKPPQDSANRWRSELAPDVSERILRILFASGVSNFYDDMKSTSAVSVPST